MSERFSQALGIGQARFSRIWKAEKANEAVPRDKRFISRKNLFPKVSVHRQLVVDFLQEMYDTMAEPLPESHGSCRVQGTAHEPARDPKPLKFRKHRGRRPKVVAKEGRRMDRSAMKMLPPGSYTSYLRMLRARHPGKPISLKLFSNVAWTRFAACGLWAFIHCRLRSGQTRSLIC